jgi:hypothetical protein
LEEKKTREVVPSTDEVKPYQPNQKSKNTVPADTSALPEKSADKSDKDYHMRISNAPAPVKE